MKYLLAMLLASISFLSNGAIISYDSYHDYNTTGEGGFGAGGVQTGGGEIAFVATTASTSCSTYFTSDLSSCSSSASASASLIYEATFSISEAGRSFLLDRGDTHLLIDFFWSVNMTLNAEKVLNTGESDEYVGISGASVRNSASLFVGGNQVFNNAMQDGYFDGSNQLYFYLQPLLNDMGMTWTTRIEMNAQASAASYISDDNFIALRSGASAFVDPQFSVSGDLADMVTMDITFIDETNDSGQVGTPFSVSSPIGVPEPNTLILILFSVFGTFLLKNGKNGCA